MDNNDQKEDKRKRGVVDTANDLASAFKNLQRIPGISQITSSLPTGSSQALGWFARLFTGTWAGVGPTIAAVFVFMVFILLFIGGTGILPIPGDKTQTQIPGPGGTQTPPIPGITLTLIGPESVNNGELLLYTVNVIINEAQLTTPLDNIVVSDVIPENSEYSNNTGIGSYDPATRTVTWSLAEVDNRSSFTITLLPTSDDTFISNKVTASLISNVDAVGGNACTAPFEGTGYCSVENLSKYFNQRPSDPLIASLICASESGGDPFKINNNCATNDYSIGLFQINAVAHCPGAYSGLSCNNLVDISARNSCQSSWTNAEENILKAKEIAIGGWAQWGTWAHAGAQPAVVETLDKCGINY